jgi:glucose/mannose-6-phosphate isomerase
VLPIISLDDLKLIHERDAQDALGVAEKQWQQLAHDFAIQTPDVKNISNIVLAGMGGSAFPAVFLNSWPGTNAPLEIVRNYNLPAYVNENTLFISSSYSGNTEETLSALAEAETRKAQIVVVSAGGKLADEAMAKNYPLYLIPGGIQPRMSSFYFLAAFIQLLEPLGLVETGSNEQLKQAGEWLKDQPTIPSSQQTENLLQ